MVKLAFHVELETVPGEVVTPEMLAGVRGVFFPPPPERILPPPTPYITTPSSALPGGVTSVAMLPPAVTAPPAVTPSIVQQPAPVLDQPISVESKNKKSVWSPIVAGGCIGFLLLFLLIKHGHKVFPFMARSAEITTVESTADTTVESTANTETAPDGETVVLEENPAAGKNPSFPNTTPDAALGDK